MLAGALAVAAPAAAPPPFELLRWTAPEAAKDALTTQPAACLTSQTVEVRAGEALFNSPSLLGGQAAKGGLSCASCHANGRGNVHFVMTGVSGAPGTADVTSSFFSAARGNGRFDPVAIPDLALPGKVSREPAAAALEPFIRTLIVEEFAGQEPTPAMLRALAAYVRAIRPCADGVALMPRTLGLQLRLTDAALDGAVGMARRGDPVAARALLAAARHQLGLIAERYAAPPFHSQQRELLAASRALRKLEGEVAEPKQFAISVSAWQARFAVGLAQQLREKERLSFYNAANLLFVAPQQKLR